MDHEKSHTTNPLMLKKQAKEAESLEFSALSKNDSANSHAAHDEITPEHFATAVSALDNLDAVDQAGSRSSASQFNLRPSTNPVSDFRRRRSYKGLANPTNTPHRQPINQVRVRPPLVSDAGFSATSHVDRPKPVAPPVEKTHLELDAAEIQNLGVQINDSKTADPDAIAELLIAQNKTKTKEKKSHRKPLLIISGLLMTVSIAIVVVLLLTKFVPRRGPDSNSGSNNPSINNTNADTQNPNNTRGEELLSDTERIVTSEAPEAAVLTDMIDDAVEVSIYGLSDSVTPNLGHKIVKVSLTNKSDVIQSVKVSIAAMDQSGKIIGVSSLYTEGINPGESYNLEAFTSTSLTDEQLANADYKIRSGVTYQTKLAPSGETE